MGFWNTIGAWSRLYLLCGAQCDLWVSHLANPGFVSDDEALKTMSRFARIGRIAQFANALFLIGAGVVIGFWMTAYSLPGVAFLCVGASTRAFACVQYCAVARTALTLFPEPEGLAYL